jgi:hypothetical protein
MTSKCIASGFTDHCQASAPTRQMSRHTQCAFGAGSNCVRCPANALCPGGYRAWPLAGYYTAAESSGTIIACPPPFQRALPWLERFSIGLAVRQAYLQGSFTCAACAAGFYPRPCDGTCSPCPYGGKPSVALQVVQPIAILIAAIWQCVVHVCGHIRYCQGS